MREIYLDNAATSFPKAPGVGEAMRRYIDEIGANIGRGSYRAAQAAAMETLETREALARLFHFSGTTNQVILTPGMTFGLNTVLRGFLNPGDHVIVGSLEHNAVMRPLFELAERGVEFSRVPAGRDGLSDSSDIEKLVRPNTKLMLVSHASNVGGGLFPLKEAAEICHKLGVPLAVDSAQTAGHYPIDFTALGLSALCVSGHKGLLGPQGIGAILMDGAFARRCRPLTTGGTGSASDSERQPDILPDKFEAGTINLPGIYGFRAALDFVLEKGVDAFRSHEITLTARLLDGLRGLPVRVAGPTDMERRVGVVSLDFTGRDNADAAFLLEQEYGVLTRCGLHCSPAGHKTLGTFPQGTVRLSIGWTTDEKDVDDAAAAVKEICED